LIIKGHVTSNVNVRKEPSTSANIVRQLLSKQTFEGDSFVKDSSGKEWIRLTKIEDVKLTETLYVANYIAAVVVDSVVTEEVPPSGEYSKPPFRITTVEEFNTNGIVTKRITIWENPTVIEE